LGCNWIRFSPEAGLLRGAVEGTKLRLASAVDVSVNCRLCLSFAKSDEERTRVVKNIM